MSRAVIAYVTDLIFATKISSTARSLGVETTTCRSVDALVEGATGGAVGLAIIDLNASGDPIDAVQRLRGLACPPRIVCYASHVQADLIAAARQAGADEVMARSVFAERLPEILREETNEK